MHTTQIVLGLTCACGSPLCPSGRSSAACPNQNAAACMSFPTPHPLPYIRPAAYCACATPFSAARRYHLTIGNRRTMHPGRSGGCRVTLQSYRTVIQKYSRGHHLGDDLTLGDRRTRGSLVDAAYLYSDTVIQWGISPWRRPEYNGMDGERTLPRDSCEACFGGSLPRRLQQVDGCPQPELQAASEVVRSLRVATLRCLAVPPHRHRRIVVHHPAHGTATVGSWSSIPRAEGEKPETDQIVAGRAASRTRGTRGEKNPREGEMVADGPVVRGVCNYGAHAHGSHSSSQGFVTMGLTLTGHTGRHTGRHTGCTRRHAGHTVTQSHSHTGTQAHRSRRSQFMRPFSSGSVV
eukprot:5798729-Pyramimonas_sp.AAC.3